MIFSRTYRYQSTLPIQEIKNKLIGKHIKTHHLDFEISEKNGVLRIIPHAENTEGVQTLPITHVNMNNKGNTTGLKISSKMRRIDSGGPYLIAIFSSFMIIAAAMFYFLGGPEHVQYAIALGAIGLFILVAFWLKMEKGYFDYVRKIRDYVKAETAAK